MAQQCRHHLLYCQNRGGELHAPPPQPVGDLLNGSFPRLPMTTTRMIGCGSSISVESAGRFPGCSGSLIELTGHHAVRQLWFGKDAVGNDEHVDIRNGIAVSVGHLDV